MIKEVRKKNILSLKLYLYIKLRTVLEETE